MKDKPKRSKHKKINYKAIYLSFRSKPVAVTVPLQSVAMIEDAPQGHTRDRGPLSED